MHQLVSISGMIYDIEFEGIQRWGPNLSWLPTVSQKIQKGQDGKDRHDQNQYYSWYDTIVVYLH